MATTTDHRSPDPDARGDSRRAAALLGDEPAVRADAGRGGGGAVDHSAPPGRPRHAARHLRPARRRVPPRRRRHRSAAYQRGAAPRCAARTDPDRDEVELALARWAMEDGKPRPRRVPRRAADQRRRRRHAVSGSGRADARVDQARLLPRPGPLHAATSGARCRIAAPTPGSARLLGTPTIRVNSMHHQGIKRLAEGLVPTPSPPTA